MFSDNVGAAIIAVTLLLLAAIPASCTVLTNARNAEVIEKAVENGVDPITASCALKGESQYGVMCALRAAQKEK